MFYQNILTDISPYQLHIGTLNSFGEHRHADLELNFSLNGSFTATVDQKNVAVGEGQLLVVSPMTAHAYCNEADSDRRVLTVVLGVSFLKNYFSCFSRASQPYYLLSPMDATDDAHRALFALLAQTGALCERRESTNELLLRGNLYKICAYLIDLIFLQPSAAQNERKEMLHVSKIERALQLIYQRHAEPLSLKDAASVTGYSISNFCKIFKGITGDTFHSVLNRQRVESACNLLSETDLPISQIARQVGFEESKTFCRVFRSITALSPGEYRRSRH